MYRRQNHFNLTPIIMLPNLTNEMFLFRAAFLHGLYFDPEDVGVIFLRKSVDIRLTTTGDFPEY
jgi:hypothetical protein